MRRNVKIAIDMSSGGAPTAATAKIGEMVDNREKQIVIGAK